MKKELLGLIKVVILLKASEKLFQKYFSIDISD
jgi:hypothetical protein